MFVWCLKKTIMSCHWIVVFEAHGLDNIYVNCYNWQLQPDPLAPTFGSHLLNTIRFTWRQIHYPHHHHRHQQNNKEKNDAKTISAVSWIEMDRFYTIKMKAIFHKRICIIRTRCYHQIISVSILAMNSHFWIN